MSTARAAYLRKVDILRGEDDSVDPVYGEEEQQQAERVCKLATDGEQHHQPDDDLNPGQYGARPEEALGHLASVRHHEVAVDRVRVAHVVCLLVDNDAIDRVGDDEAQPGEVDHSEQHHAEAEREAAAALLRLGQVEPRAAGAGAAVEARLLRIGMRRGEHGFAIHATFLRCISATFQRSTAPEPPAAEYCGAEYQHNPYPHRQAMQARR